MKAHFEKYVFDRSLIYKYAMGRSVASGTEIHPYHEILYFLGSSGEFISENDQITAKEGMLFIIPKETYHMFRIEDQSQYCRCVLSFPDISEISPLIEQIMADGTVKIIEKAPSVISGLFDRLNRSFEDKITEEDRRILLSSLFRQLLIELKICGGNLSVLPQKETDSLISRAIEYIGIHLFDELTVEKLATRLSVSKSLLSHCFKKELNISPHRYITEKRLVYAHKMIGEGTPATEASILCGYSDYSTFFRAYKKMFAENPSKKKP